MPSRHQLDPPLLDPRGPRVAAGITALVLGVALAAGSPWLPALLVGQAVVFALGAAGRSPYGVLYARLVRPRLSPPAELEDPRPVRFAQAVGLAFTLVALAGAAVSSDAVTVVAAALALAAAFLNAAFGLCLGCEAHLLRRRATSSTPIARTVPDPRTAIRSTEEVHA